MPKIAADVGLTDGGLLCHFPSKKHLLLAVAEHRTGVAVVHLAPPPGDARGDQPTMARRSR